ncbi:MAG: nucleotide triphosphate diphosphatase NUDT15 [Dehalococcoidia bacterium]
MHSPEQVFREYESAGGLAAPSAFCPHCGSPWNSAADEPWRWGACGKRTFRNPSPAVSVLVTDGPRFLLCRRRARSFQGSQWCLPSGYVEFQEDFLTAARREVMDETGLAVQVSGLLSVVSNFFRPDLHSLVVVLLAHPTDPSVEPTGGDDIEIARWFDDPQALPEMAFEADTHIIRRAFATGLRGTPIDPRFAGR